MTSDFLDRVWSQRAQWLRRLKAAARSGVDAEDLLQDIFCELVLANRAAVQIENLSGWIMRVAKNRLIDAARKRDRETALAQRDISPGENSASDPESSYRDSITDARIRSALMQLPEAQREVFIAHEFEGEPFAAMALRTGESQNTLLARKHYAVRKLRELLGPLYFDSTHDEDETS
ncbi:MAG: sigma-70 family RNA polymerase sigma factor [Rudaea sp.]